MKLASHYQSIVSSAAAIAKECYNNQESISKMEAKSKDIIDGLQNHFYTKVRFVGDFSAGKSALLNTLMDNTLLPTDVLPTTAVSYELYHSETEKLAIFHDGKLKETTTLDRINSLSVVPGDIVKVYVNNAFVKEQNERGIVPVDMPGIDSGIEAHNNAILNYIQEGTFFILVSPAPAGTLRGTTLRFADELKKYNLDMAVIVSKADQAAENGLQNTIDLVTNLAKQNIGANVKVGVTSSAEKKVQDVLDILNGIDAEKFLMKKYSLEVINFINTVISELQLQIRVLATDKSTYGQKIAELEAQKETSLANLRSSDTTAQAVNSSAEDILDDVREAIIANSAHLANTMMTSPNGDVINSELLNVIRPVLHNSFKRELTEYQEAIGDCLIDFSDKVNEILQDKDNPLLKEINKIIDKNLTQEVMDGAINKGFDKLLERFQQLSVGKFGEVLKAIIPIIKPLLTILIQKIPEFINSLFGKGKEKKLAEIQQVLTNELVGKIVESLREPVEQMLEEQRREAYSQLEAIIDNEAAKYDESIRKMQEEKQADEAAKKAKIQSLLAKVAELQQLAKTI